MSTQDELIALRAELAALTAKVDAILPMTAPTMARQHRCPACSATRIARVSALSDRGDGNLPRDMALVVEQRWFSVDVIGELGCYTCTACGLVELYVRDPSTLREVEGKITITESAPPAPPYR